MEERAHDKNFAVIFSFIDVAFGTFYCPDEKSLQCGVSDIPSRQGFLRLLALPFQLNKARREPSIVVVE
jgi:sterol desaturase/sphingolipid hydroxylase (fatty acid hydroxylase superfamily)